MAWAPALASSFGIWAWVLGWAWAPSLGSSQRCSPGSLAALALGLAAYSPWPPPGWGSASLEDITNATNRIFTDKNSTACSSAACTTAPQRCRESLTPHFRRMKLCLVQAPGSEPPLGAPGTLWVGSRAPPPAAPKYTELKRSSGYASKLFVASKPFCGLTAHVRPNLGPSNSGQKTFLKLN